MHADQIFNLCEGVLWLSIAVILLCRSIRPSIHRTLLRVSGVAFLLFGFSDFIEIFTRAWFCPPALLILKTTCVITFIACFILYRQSRKKGISSAIEKKPFRADAAHWREPSVKD